MKSAELNKNERKVLSALGRAVKPLSAYDILDRARSDALKAPVQVYRALEKLSSRGLVHRIEALNAFVACSDARIRHTTTRHEAIAHAEHRPGFVICRDCGSVREFEDERRRGHRGGSGRRGFRRRARVARGLRPLRRLPGAACRRRAWCPRLHDAPSRRGAVGPRTGSLGWRMRLGTRRHRGLRRLALDRRA